MSRIEDSSKNEPVYKMGLNGNYYVYCNSKEPLEVVCEAINKAPSSIYFSKEYNVWAIKAKIKKHIDKLKMIKKYI